MIKPITTIVKLLYSMALSPQIHNVYFT